MRKIYYNADVITMEEGAACQAILTEDDMIVRTGTNKEILSLCHDAVKTDMNGRTVMPAFIDSHGHFMARAADMLSADLRGCTSVIDILECISEYIHNNDLKDGEWVTASGYDFSGFQDNIKLTARDLDSLGTDHPVAVKHSSGHSGVFSTRAQEAADVSLIDGKAEEQTYMRLVGMIPPPSYESLINACTDVQDIYFSYGIVTAQEGMLVSQMLELYRKLVTENKLRLRINGYASMSDFDTFAGVFADSIRKYHNNFRLMGLKIFLDGSPQLRTAWMKTPYAYGTGGYPEYGTQVMTEKEVSDAYIKARKENVQLLAHCNGDAAAQQLIDAAMISRPLPERTVMIHSQLLDVNQMGSLKKYGIIPSFFIAHVYHWGDVHIQNFGEGRASVISAANSAARNGLVFTFHQDTPVIEPDMLETVWCAVNRITKSGVCLGKEERLNVYEALKAVTVNAAYQYSDENEYGSICENKKADFVVLSQNPLMTANEKLREIKVLQTISGGETVFKRQD